MDGKQFGATCGNESCLCGRVHLGLRKEIYIYDKEKDTRRLIFNFNMTVQN